MIDHVTRNIARQWHDDQLTHTAELCLSAVSDGLSDDRTDYLNAALELSMYLITLRDEGPDCTMDYLRKHICMTASDGVAPVIIDDLFDGYTKLYDDVAASIDYAAFNYSGTDEDREGARAHWLLWNDSQED